jgi:hypothetical protein
MLAMRVWSGMSQERLEGILIGAGKVLPLRKSPGET